MLTHTDTISLFHFAARWGKSSVESGIGKWWEIIKELSSL